MRAKIGTAGTLLWVGAMLTVWAGGVVNASAGELKLQTQLVWGTDDIYFPVKWAHWLADTIPGAKPPVELKGARLFFPEERAEVFNKLLRDHLLTS